MHEWYCRIGVACDTIEFEFVLLSPPLVRSTPLASPCNVAHAYTNIQQVAAEEEEEEEEGDTPHIDTWCNAKVWVDFFGDLHK